MKSVVVLSLAAVALCAPAPESRPTKVRLPRRPHFARNNGGVDGREFLGNLQYTLNKYGKHVELLPGLESIIKREPVGEEALNDQGDDELYYGNIGINTQTFTCDFDTGSSDLFVPGPKCTSADGCTGTVRYNEKGTDEHNTTSVTYGSGEVKGENYFDSVTVAGYTATHQNLISLTTASGFSDSKAAGLMGMAFQSIAASGQPPFFETLIAEGKVAVHEFSFYLGRESSGTGGNSQLTLGGRDSSKYTGAFHKVPLSAETYWQTAVESVLVNGKSTLLSAAGLDLTKGNSAIDTGTTVILAPTVAATAIFTSIVGSVPIPLVEGVGTTIFAYPCDSTPTVAFKYAGKDFAVAKEDFNLGELTTEFAELIKSKKLLKLIENSPVNYCLAAIIADDIDPEEELYVVGDTFLKSWYATFSFDNYNGKPSVSFAPSVQ